MSIEVIAGELAAALSQLAACVEKKTTIPILSSVMLKSAGGTLGLRATDLEIGLGLQIPCASMAEEIGCVDLSRLLPVVKSLPKDQAVSLTITDNLWCTLKSGKVRARIPGFDPKSFPELPPLPEKSVVTVAAKSLTQLVNRTAFCINREETRFTLNGGLLQVAGGVATMVATDGHRMAVARAEAEGEFRKIVAAKGMAVLSRLFDGAEGNIDIYSDPNHTMFVGPKGECVTVRDLTGNFPEWQRVFPNDMVGKFQVSSADLLTAIGRCMTFADGHSKAMRFRIIDEGIEVRANASEMGDAEDVVPCQHDGLPYTVGFNGSYIADVARQAAALEWHFKDGNHAALFKTLDGSGQWVVMPQRF